MKTTRYERNFKEQPISLDKDVIDRENALKLFLSSLTDEERKGGMLNLLDNLSDDREYEYITALYSFILESVKNNIDDARTKTSLLLANDLYENEEELNINLSNDYYETQFLFKLVPNEENDEKSLNNEQGDIENIEDKNNAVSSIFKKTIEQKKVVLSLMEQIKEILPKSDHIGITNAVICVCLQNDLMLERDAQVQNTIFDNIYNGEKELGSSLSIVITKKLKNQQKLKM